MGQTKNFYEELFEIALRSQPNIVFIEQMMREQEEKELLEQIAIDTKNEENESRRIQGTHRIWETGL